MGFLCVIFAICLFLCPASRTGFPAGSVQSWLDPDNILTSQSHDFDGDGTTETVIVTYGTMEDDRQVGGEVLVLSEIDGLMEIVWSRDDLNPWKLETGDVDGDGLLEIAFGVWKESPFDPVMANRVFFYNWDGETMQPKWLGSRLSRRFDDFTLFDINSDGWDELIAMEIMGEDEHRVAVYRWDIFGFEWLGCSDEISGIQGFHLDDGVLNVLTMSDRFEIEFQDDNVIIKSLELTEE